MLYIAVFVVLFSSFAVLYANKRVYNLPTILRSVTVNATITALFGMLRI